MTGEKDIKGLAFEDTTAKPPVNAPTSAVLEGQDDDVEDAEHVEPLPDDGPHEAAGEGTMFVD